MISEPSLAAFGSCLCGRQPASRRQLASSVDRTTRCSLLSVTAAGSDPPQAAVMKTVMGNTSKRNRKAKIHCIGEGDEATTFLLDDTRKFKRNSQNILKGSSSEVIL